LQPGSSIRSSNQCFGFEAQSDGNFVLYRRSNNQPLWASGTDRRNVKHTVFQNDGNLVIYNTSNNPIWASNTDRRSGTRLTVQDDGNVVMYTAQGQAVWHTNTVTSCNVTPQPPAQRQSERKVNAFANDWLNKTVWRKDDRTLDGQCVSLIARYLQDHYSKGALWIGDGRTTASSIGSQFPEFLPLSDPSLPIPGSIMSFAATSSNSFGHVALVRSVQRNSNNTLTLTILESNVDTNTSAPNSKVRQNTIILNLSNLRVTESDGRAWRGSASWVNPRD
jgi:CHAP domain